MVRSWFERPGLRGATILTANQKVITRRLGKRNDGMVTYEDQWIPDAKVVITYDDLDHFEPGVRAHSSYSPTRVTNDALDAMLRYVVE